MGLVISETNTPVIAPSRPTGFFFARMALLTLSPERIVILEVNLQSFRHHGKYLFFHRPPSHLAGQ